MAIECTQLLTTCIIISIACCITIIDYVKLKKGHMRYIKTLILFVISVVLLILVGSSCKKENGSKSVVRVTTNALIFDSGPVAADGCGWLVKIDSNVYHANNLPAEFQQNKLAVNVSFEKIESGFQCSMDPKNILPSIHITNIVKSGQ